MQIPPVRALNYGALAFADRRPKKFAGFAELTGNPMPLRGNRLLTGASDCQQCMHVIDLVLLCPEQYENN
jgi:hypothetical protein